MFFLAVYITLYACNLFGLEHLLRLFLTFPIRVQAMIKILEHKYLGAFLFLLSGKVLKISGSWGQRTRMKI